MRSDMDSETLITSKKHRLDANNKGAFKSLNQLVGVQIPVPQYFSCSVKNAEQVNSPNPVIPLTPIMSSRPLSYKRSDSTTTPRENHSFWFTIEPVCFFL